LFKFKRLITGFDRTADRVKPAANTAYKIGMALVVSEGVAYPAYEKCTKISGICLTELTTGASVGTDEYLQVDIQPGTVWTVPYFATGSKTSMVATDKYRRFGLKDHGTLNPDVASSMAVAAKTADSALGASVGLDAATKIMINGVEVTLTNVKALGAGYDAATNVALVVVALQKDIDATALRGKITVTNDSTKLVLSTVLKGTGVQVDLTGSATTTGATLLGFTTLTGVVGTETTTSCVVTLIDYDNTKHTADVLITSGQIL
jgi:hypothetical protein